MKRHPLLVGFGVFAGLLLFFGIIVYAVMIRMYERDGQEWFATVTEGSVAVLYLKGPIVESEEWIKQLEIYRKDDSVKAVVLRINSPGGLVAPSQEMYEEVKRVRAEKIVVASFGDIAASGAYYVAAGADHIMANPGTLTGSIGVIMQLESFEDLLQWMKVKSHTVKSGEFKDIGNPMRTFTDDERSRLQGFIDNLHEQFVRAIVEGRDMDAAQVRALATGMIYTGEQAHDSGLVDRLGTFRDAIAWAGELAGLGAEPAVVYPPEKKRSFVETLMESATDLAVESVYAARARSSHPWYLYTGAP